MTAARDPDLSHRIHKLLEPELTCDITEVTDDTPLVSSGLLDSVSIAFLINAIEDAEGITIADESLDVGDFETIARIKALIRKRLEST
jgi:acyl carrier protein